MERKEDHVVLTSREARGARWGKPVLVVLVVSIILVVVGFVLSWLPSGA